MGSILGSMWGRFWGRCGVDVRYIIIYKVERLVTPPSLIFYKRDALLAEVEFPIRTPKQKCGTVTIITAFFNKVLKIMKTVNKAKSLAKERSLPKKKQST